MLLLVALMAGGAMMYYRGTRDDTRLEMAHEELVRIRDEILRWTLTPGHKVTATLTDLPRFKGQDLLDPWGKPYVVHFETQRVVSGGPNGVLETAENAPGLLGDDLGIAFGRVRTDGATQPSAATTAPLAPDP